MSWSTHRSTGRSRGDTDHDLAFAHAIDDVDDRDVPAGAAVDDIAPPVDAVDPIVASTSGHEVAARPRIDAVIARPPEHAIVARASEQPVVATAAVQAVIPR